MEELKTLLKKEQLYNVSSSSTSSLYYCPKKDLASHYILRAAYCRTEELRKWFLTQECALMKYKWEECPEHLLQSSHIIQNDYEIVSSEEMIQHQLHLLSSNNNNNKSTIYYKIPFTQALDLIATRQCQVHHGYAFVPLSKIISTMITKFRTLLSKSLVLACASFDQVLTSSAEASRLSPLLQTMNAQSTSSSIHNTTQMYQEEEELNAGTVNDYVKHMPLCMSQLHTGLVREHKLKHFGRLQYILFLKGAGMSLEESMTFFQTHFTKLVSTDVFHKQYAYTIRHLYGKEGQRRDKRPYNCTKIIFEQPPQAGQIHGCPYRHYDADHLSALLHKLHIPQANEILDLKKQKQHQLACVKHFQVTHPNATTDVTNVGTHPNAWFAASINYHKQLNNNTTPIKQEPKKE